MEADSVFATNSGRYERSRSGPLLGTLADRDCNSPTLLAVARATRKRVFWVSCLRVEFSKGS